MTWALIAALVAIALAIAWVGSKSTDALSSVFTGPLGIGIAVAVVIIAAAAAWRRLSADRSSGDDAAKDDKEGGKE